MNENKWEKTGRKQLIYSNLIIFKINTLNQEFPLNQDLLLWSPSENIKVAYIFTYKNTLRVNICSEHFKNTKYFILMF